MISSKEVHGRLFPKVHCVEHLEVADIRYGIGPDILRVEFEKMEDISEELWPGRRKATVHVVSKDNDFTISWIGPFFVRVRCTVRHDIFSWQKSYGEELLQTFLSHGWGNPVADSRRFGRHSVQKCIERKVTCRFNPINMVKVKDDTGE